MILKLIIKLMLEAKVNLNVSNQQATKLEVTFFSLFLCVMFFGKIKHFLFFFLFFSFFFFVL